MNRHLPLTNFLNTHKFAITGANGFIGKHLTEKLISLGATDITAIDISPIKLNNQHLKIINSDITHPGALDNILDENTILFHLAARADVPLSVKDPAGDFKNTLCGYFEILESARKKKSAIIFPSTASIYDPSNSQPVNEKSWIRPSSPYAAAKASGEHYSIVYHRCYGLNVKIARMFSVYGPGMKRFAIYDIINKIKNNPREIEILGDGTQIRDYLYIDDIIDGLLIIAMNGKAGEDYNLGSGIPVQLLELTQMIARLMGHPDIKIKTSGNSFPGDVLRWYADIKKISSLGFKQRIPLEDGLKKTIHSLIDGI